MIAFLLIALGLGMLENSIYNGRNNLSDFEKRVDLKQQSQSTLSPAPAALVAKPAVTTTATNNVPMLLTTPETVPAAPAPAK